MTWARIGCFGADSPDTARLRPVNGMPKSVPTHPRASVIGFQLVWRDSTGTSALDPWYKRPAIISGPYVRKCGHDIGDDLEVIGASASHYCARRGHMI